MLVVGGRVRQMVRWRGVSSPGSWEGQTGKDPGLPQQHRQVAGMGGRGSREASAVFLLPELGEAKIRDGLA